MLDLSYFQNSGNVNTQTFTNAGTWVTWQKPRGAKFVNTLCIGSGGGGTNGVSSSASTRGTGGGAGGGGGIVRAQFQASVLPDILYIYTGVGGSGGVGGSQKTTFDSAGNGERSFICLIPDTSSISNIVVTSGATSARGATGNAGAVGETIATTANAIFFNLGTFIAVAGTNGGTGVAAIAGTAVTPTQITTGGSGGAGTGAAGGFAAAGFYPSASNIASSAGAGTNGSDGFMFTKPVLAFRGGAGGGGGGTGPGGNGGNGSYGCGGGGGGGCLNVGGNGGRGGDGIVIITTSF